MPQKNLLPPPFAFGLPPHFTEWREHQDEAFQDIVDSLYRFSVLVCPTGFGKSIMYMSAALIGGGRTCILTSTKGLQNQLIDEFREVGSISTIKGRANYTCRLNSERTCDEGACVFGYKCPLMEDGGCYYYDALKKAKMSRIVITNYSYWMSQNEFSDGIGKFDTLVLDEAHASPDHVIDHLGVTFSRMNRVEEEVLELRASLPVTISDWISWAVDKKTTVETLMANAKTNRKEKLFLSLKRLMGKLERLIGTIDKTWIWEESDDGITLSPIWPAPYTEDVLWLSIPKIVLTSATVVPKTCDLLGIGRGDMMYKEYPHSFPVENRPLIHVPTVRMNFRNTPTDEKLWLVRLDQIIRTRQDTKGIIHTTSYSRAKLVLDNSKYNHLMVTHRNLDTVQVVSNFKKADAPCILVSPSMTTGWDFPYDECRWQVIVKLPYPDTRGNIMKARSKSDGDFTSYITMQQLIQACGRGVRAKDDWCDTFILDDSIEWFLPRYKKLSVEWFEGAYQFSRVVPEPKH